LTMPVFAFFSASAASRGIETASVMELTLLSDGILLPSKNDPFVACF
jgi:hypothetical protein